MQCKKIQELLTSDYLDGETNQRERKFIDEHLGQCPACLRHLEELQAQRALFQKAKRQQVPERIWLDIRDNIVMERLNQESRLSRRILDLERLKGFLFPPRPVFALASALTTVIFVMIFAVIVNQKNQYFSKENELFSGYSLNSDNGDSLADLGTNIEQYFL